jgi:hypothetical protein
VRQATYTGADNRTASAVRGRVVQRLPGLACSVAPTSALPYTIRWRAVSVLRPSQALLRRLGAVRPPRRFVRISSGRNPPSNPRG